MLCWICRLFWTRDEICFLQFTVKLLLISLFVLPSPCWYSNLSMASLKTTERRKWLTAQTDENVERETFSVNLSFLSRTLTVCRIAEVSEGTMFIPFHRSTAIFNRISCKYETFTRRDWSASEMFTAIILNVDYNLIVDV